MLTDDQKRTWLDISRYLLSRYEDDFMELVVTQDETWVHHFDRLKNAEQTMEAPWLTHSMGHPAWKVMAPIFWDSQGLIIIDDLEQRCILWN